jgi:hypothetical protein
MLCGALEGHRVSQLPAHLEDEEVPPVAAYVSEPRGNEPKRLRDLLCTGARNPGGGDERFAQAEFGQPGRYRLRVLDPDSGVTSKPFVVVIKG